jgi:hypothetical protein
VLLFDNNNNRVKWGDHMTVLGDRLAKLSTSNKHTPCPMAKLLKSLDTDTAVALIDVMSKEEIPTRTIHQELHNAGIPIARESIQVFRKNNCACASEDKCNINEITNGGTK